MRDALIPRAWQSPRGLSLLAACASAVSAFALVHCSGGSSGSPQGAGHDGGTDAGDATADVSTTDTGPGDAGQDSAAPTDTGAAPGDAASDVVEAAIPCDAASGCSGSLTCCSSICVDIHHDPRNCGACGTTCNATQFCTGTQCDDAVFANVCANPTVTVVTDPYTIDSEAGTSLGHALAACSDAGVALSIVPQTQPGVLVPMGDAGARPNTGVPSTLVAGGSWYGQLAVAYMDNTGATPVYLTNDGTTSHIYQRSTGLAVVTAADTTLTAQHDFFILELAVEPQSGTLCFFGEGILGAGTLAAAYYGSSVVVPGRATYTAPWYVYEWTDTNSDMMPDQGDTFSLAAQGP